MQIVYTSASAAKEAAAGMNCFNLGGLPLVVLYNPSASSLPITSVAPAVAASVPVKVTLVLEDMIGIDEVNDPDLPEEIQEEAEKYGKVKNIDIKVDSNKPKIFVVFEDGTGADRAFKAMNGRNFGGNIIAASLQ